MTVKELIQELQKLPPDLPCCGESETTTWEIQPDELKPTKNVVVDYPEPKKHPEALILGFNNLGDYR
jgi:hypothetical protein